MIRLALVLLVGLLAGAAAAQAPATLVADSIVVTGDDRLIAHTDESLSRIFWRSNS